MKTNETKHTEGPWRSVLLTEYHHGYEWPVFTVRDARNHCLAVVGEVDRATAEDNAANARLIAAAPEMLASLRKAEGLLCSIGNEAAASRYGSIKHNYELIPSILNELITVIAKAEGRAI